MSDFEWAYLGRQDPDEVGEVVEDVRDEDYGSSPSHGGDDAPGQGDKWSSTWVLV